jgi:hypothetical protein
MQVMLGIITNLHPYYYSVTIICLSILGEIQVYDPTDQSPFPISRMCKDIVYLVPKAHQKFTAARPSPTAVSQAGTTTRAAALGSPDDDADDGHHEGFLPRSSLFQGQISMYYNAANPVYHQGSIIMKRRWYLLPCFETWIAFRVEVLAILLIRVLLLSGQIITVCGIPPDTIDVVVVVN